MIPIRDSQPSYSKPIVVTTIIVLNVLVFLYQISLNRYESNFFVEQFGFVPDRFSVLDLFTSMFMHGGWMHIIGNMLFLWVFGDNIEDILGKPKFIVFYLLCGIAAAGTQYLDRSEFDDSHDRRQRGDRRRDGRLHDQVPALADRDPGVLLLYHYNRTAG